MPLLWWQLLKSSSWVTAGDVNAFFGLALDNIANLVLIVGLLTSAFGFPANFAVEYMLPGTALGVLVGDAWFTWMALRLARRTGRPVTAMPLGLDTPSTIGMVFFVLGPAFLAARGQGLGEHESAQFAWRIGMAAIVVSGLFKLVCSLASGWARRIIPRAGLLGSLTAIALVLISFLPLLDVMQSPIVGILSLAIILGSLTARLPLPFGVPGAVVAVTVSVIVFYAMIGLNLIERPPSEITGQLALNWPRPNLEWLAGLRASLPYLPIVLPFALATVVGGIDCAESASAAGDEYDTREVIAAEAVATLVAGVCGGVIQTTPYIGHPAYKAMGGRAAYTLATAIFIGGAGMLGYFSFIYEYIPRAAIFPVLIFVGLEITAQSFHATPVRHYPAVALSCVPALAYLVTIFLGSVLPHANLARLSPSTLEQLATLRVLGSGFILTSLIWASMLAALIDRKLRFAAIGCAMAGVCSLFGVIHSPLDGGRMFLPWAMPTDARGSTHWMPVQLAVAYLLAGIVFLLWSAYFPAHPSEIIAANPNCEHP